MTITLSPDLDRFLQEEVAAGRYPSVSEAVREAVERLRRERETNELKQSLVEARASLERGEGVLLRDEAEVAAFFDDLEARGRRRLEERAKP